MACCLGGLFEVPTASQDAIRITPKFSGETSIAPNTPLELETSRPLEESEGQLAILIGDLDVTDLSERTSSGLTYTPRLSPLPIGETSVIVYLVSRAHQWTEIGRFPLLVEGPDLTPVGRNDGSTTSTDNLPPNPAKGNGPNPFTFNPSVSVNVKAQSVALFFPESSRPNRINFTDVAVQASLQGNYSREHIRMQNQFDLSGTSVQNEALRFGELGNNALQVDLSSYLMQYQIGKAALKLGNVSFGTNRHLINSFSSRGLSFTVPINKRFDVSAGAANGTSIVGFNNFFGLNRTKHQILSATLGVEVFDERPGGLRVEVGTLKGSLLPLANFNQRNINDAETSRGVSFRVIGSDSQSRLRFDGGFARSRFTNPADPLLYQGRDVVPVKPASRNARYLDVNYDILRSYKVSESRPLSLAVSYRHERVDPLFRSIAAFASADRLSNQVDVTGSLGDISFGFSDARSNDNLAGALSILKTLTRRNAFQTSFSTASLFGNTTKPNALLPRLSYSFDRVHQFADFVPINGDFNSPSNVPDQVSVFQNFSAEWQLSEKMRLGYRFNHSFQDSRQLTRERFDLLNQINGVTVGFTPTRKLDLNFDMNAERASDFDRNAITTTLRFGTGINWRMTNTMVWAINTSTTGAGDRADTNDRRDIDFDIQYSWRFLATEKNRWQKVQGQFFIRYANRYASARDRLFGFDNLTKFQVFNAGLNLVFF